MAKKKAPKIDPPKYPKVIETFREVSDYELNGYSSRFDSPSAFNGAVCIKKYRITVEVIDEPIEVYQERLEKLWVECDNWHHWAPLEKAAQELSYTFKGEKGSQRKARQ